MADASPDWQDCAYPSFLRVTAKTEEKYQDREGAGDKDDGQKSFVYMDGEQGMRLRCVFDAFVL